MTLTMPQNELRVEIDKADQKRILGKFKSLNKFVTSEIDPLINKQAEKVVKEMKAEVPVDTGRLQRNIYTLNRGDVQIIQSEAISPGNQFNYAPVIENFGGRFARGLHYFTKGINRFKARIRRDISTRVKSILNNRL